MKGPRVKPLFNKGVFMKIGILLSLTGLVLTLGTQTARAESDLQIYKCAFGKVVGGVLTPSPYDYAEGNLVASDVQGLKQTTYLGLKPSGNPSAAVYGYQLSTGERHLLLSIVGAEEITGNVIFQIGESPIQADAKLGGDTYRLQCQLR